MINYQSTARVSSPVDSVDTWNFASQITPHPVSFGYWTAVDSSGESVGDFHAMLNQQLLGDDHVEKMTTFLEQCERWRLAYLGVTVHFDGPALANQGTIVVNQAPYAPLTYSASLTNSGGLGEIVAYPSIHVADGGSASLGPDFPRYDRSITMPNSYTGQVKDGVYVPLKLTKTCQQWRSKSDLRLWTTSIRESGEFGTARLALPQTAGVLQYPLPGFPIFAYATLSGPELPAQATSSFLNDVVANICARNMSVDASLIFTFRVGIEAMVEPGSILSPYQRVSPQYDSAALKSYFLVSRELKDAYPADFNDLGRLWDVISGAVNTVAPLLGVIHPALGMGARGVVMAGDAIRKIASKPKGMKQTGAPAAAVDREVKTIMKKLDSVATRKAAVVRFPKKKKGSRGGRGKKVKAD